MAAYAALVSLTNSIDQIMTCPRFSTFLDNAQIQSLRIKSGFLLDSMDGYNHGGEITKAVEDLERSIACVAHEAEDVIESHIVDQIQAGSNQPSPGRTVDLQRIIQDIDAILKADHELTVKERVSRSREEEHLTHSTTPLTEAGESGTVGFEDDLTEVMGELANDRPSRDTISIVGMGGTGKTTLAKTLYASPLIKGHFDVLAWATVFQQDNLMDILTQLLCSRGESSAKTVDELGEELYKTLYGRRYLIVLDDIWSAQAWVRVRRFFPDDGSGSRVVLTTRLSNLARECSCSYSFTMKPLDEHTSWKLLCKKAFEQETCPNPELEGVGMEIARLCRGLPLTTVVVGGLLLKSPRSLRFWESVVSNIRSNHESEEKKQCLDILALSYNHLPPSLKPCFLYLGVFKADSEIRVSKIVDMWIAEGFLRPKNNHSLRQVGEFYLKELIDRNMISVSKRRKNGKMGSCGIHGLMRELCFRVAKRQECFHSRPSLTRSLRQGATAYRPVSYKFQRVCNEDYLESPEMLYWCVNLRYLAHRPPLHSRTRWKLPTSLSLIWNLQTIIIQQPDWSYRAVVAPAEIWKMRQLRHVKCSNLELPPPPPRDGGLLVMENLQTLTTAVNFKLSEEVCAIVPNIKKLRLAYGDEWHGHDDSFMECVRNLDRLRILESLKVHVPNMDHALDRILTFPSSLNKLSLTGCLLRWEDLSVIGSLPSLQVLELRHMLSNAGKQWSPVDGQFLRLKFLKLDFCDLHCWEAESSHFPVLQKVILADLWYLKEIPWCIGEIPTLELIRVDYCSESAGISAVKIREEQENQGNDSLQVEVAIRKSDVENFKKGAGTKGIVLKRDSFRAM